MKITLQDILKKYDTNLNIDQMDDNLKNKVLFSTNNEDKPVVTGMINLDDIKQPEHEQLEEGYESYYYKFGEYELEVIAKPSDNKSVDVTFRYPTPENVPEPYFVFNWRHDGSRGIMI